MVHITTEPIELVVNDLPAVNMQADPTNSKEWHVLLEVEVTYGDKQAEAHTALVDAMAALAETPEDAEALKGWDVGTRTLKLVAERYVQEVTGFPTVPSPSSTKRSRKTGGNSAQSSP